LAPVIICVRFCRKDSQSVHGVRTDGEKGFCLLAMANSPLEDIANHHPTLPGFMQYGLFAGPEGKVQIMPPLIEMTCPEM
jgi:hypothetical protein